MSRRGKKPRLTAEQALAQAFGRVDHTPLLEALGVDLEDEMLCLALTHRSFANEHDFLPNNERLEFIGDAILGLTVATKLYELYPEHPESDLSPMRASIVSRYGLADIAREINLGEHIILGRGEEVTGGREKDSILADTTEALFGAILRVHGFEVARDVILRLFHHKLHHASARGKYQDWKTVLQERMASYKHIPCEYVTTTSGPEHNLVFSSTVVINGTSCGTAQGQSKKFAEQEAAELAVKYLNKHPGVLTKHA